MEKKSPFKNASINVSHFWRWLATAVLVWMGAVFAERSWGQEMDTTPPNTNVYAGPSSVTNKTYAKFYFTATETATFQCQLDGAPYAACMSPAYYSGLAVGAHSFKVYAIDVAGNIDATPANRAWVIDLTPPDTTISSTPVNPTNQPIGKFYFTSTESGSSFRCRVDSGIFWYCSSPYSSASLPEGAHTFEVKAVDRAGNHDPTPAGFAWTIDLTPPDTTVSAAVGTLPLNSGTVTDSTSITFTFKSTDGSSFLCQLDVGTPVPCASPNSRSVSEGSHVFSVSAVDPVGNADPTPATFSWTVDLVPTVYLLSVPAWKTNQADATFQFSASEAGCTFECALDSGVFGACSSPHTASGLSDGSHTFHVKATDSTGNTSATVDYSWSVDTQPPDTLITPEPPALTGPSAFFGFVSSDGDGSAFQCSIDGMLFKSCIPAVHYDYLTDGVHTFGVRAVDATGNTDPTPATHTWRVDGRAPNFEGVLSAVALSASKVELSWNAAVDDSTATESISYQICHSEYCGECGANFIVRQTAPPGAVSLTVDSLSSARTYSFVVRAVDEWGNVDRNVKEMSARTKEAPGSLLLSVEGDSAYGYFGTSVAGIGDIDGDGKAEFAVGATGSPCCTVVAPDMVRVYSWVDPMASPEQAILRYTVQSPQYGSGFGRSLAAGGDVNADGTPDFMVGTHFQDAVYVHSGLDGSLLLRLAAPAAGEGLFGQSMAIVGDTNGDGHDDLMVGDPRPDIMSMDPGRVYLFSGADGSLLRDIFDAAGSPSAGFGSSVSAAGDLDGDGTSDYLVGAPWQDAGGPWPNRTGAVYALSPNKGLLHVQFGAADAEQFGVSVSGAIDLNGDGSPDYIVSSGVTVTVSAFSGMDGTRLYKISSAGGPVALSPDLNGDGRGDIIASNQVFSGADGSWLFSLMPPWSPVSPGGMADTSFGQAVAAAGDVNGDGIADILVGASTTTVSSIFGTLEYAGAAHVFTGGRP